MKAPVFRRRSKWPTLPTRTMDLLGVGQDGNLYLWSEAAQVQPLDRFPVTPSGHIVSGHYIIERNGRAVTAHINPSAVAGQVVVQTMGGGVPIYTVPQKHIEGDLLGRYVPDPQAEAEILDMLRRMAADAEARQTAPHRKRGAA